VFLLLHFLLKKISGNSSLPGGGQMPGFRLWLLHLELQHRGFVIFNKHLHTLELCDILPEGPVLVVRRKIVLQWSQLPSVHNLPNYEWLSAVDSASLLRHYRWENVIHSRHGAAGPPDA
jgi:hypothetical protein